MENIISKQNMEEEQIELPPGFRFHPTDEELITHYLSQKVLDNFFSAKAIGEVDLNKCEPWDLPWRAKMGEKEWYFFCLKDRKYPTGLRTNRATDSGYWKATGKDKEIYRGKILVGMKKTLVFYGGRAPRGQKTNWVMHEYRLEGKYSVDNLPKTAKNEWVICRIFQKISGEKKTGISGLMKMASNINNPTSVLPPLMDSSPPHSSQTTKTTVQKTTSYVPCFSIDDQKTSFFLPSSSSSKPILPNSSISNLQNLQYSDSSVLMQDEAILTMLLENMDSKAEISLETGESTDFSSVVSGHYAEDCLWNY